MTSFFEISLFKRKESFFFSLLIDKYTHTEKIKP